MAKIMLQAGIKADFYMNERNKFYIIHENDPDMTHVDDISEQQAIEMVGSISIKLSRSFMI